MGIAQLYYGEKNAIDHIIHFVVALFILIIHIIQITNNSHGVLARGLAALLVAGMGIQAAYHLGVGLKYQFTDEKKEAVVGQIARNLLTSLSLGVAAARAGVLDHRNISTAELTLAWLSFGLLCLMKLLDGVLDAEADEWFVSTKCPRDFNDGDDPTIIKEFDTGVGCCDQTFGSKVGMNGRLIITHLLLIPSALFLLINHNDTSDVAMLIALVSISVHAFLYPALLILNFITMGNFNILMIMILRGDPACDSLESLSRVPLIRTIVTLLAIPTLSYAVGESAGLVANANVASWDLMLALALYLGADAIGRNVV